MPAIIECITKIAEPTKANCINQHVISISGKLHGAINTRNQNYYFFIRTGVVGSQKSAQLTCICGATNAWGPPHDRAKLYCSSCGKSFQLIEVDAEYIMTPNGPVKVVDVI